MFVFPVGDECPMGAYCLEGSDSPSLCPSGTYLNSTRNTNGSACIQCTAGYYCSGSGNDYPTGKISTVLILNDLLCMVVTQAIAYYVMVMTIERLAVFINVIGFT